MHHATDLSSFLWPAGIQSYVIFSDTHDALSFLSHSVRMTFDSASRLLLIFAPSCLPETPCCLAFSLPARSTRFYTTETTAVTLTNSQHTHTRPFNGPLSGTTQMGRYQKKHSPTNTHPEHQTIGVSGWTFLRELAHPGSPRQRANNQFQDFYKPKFSLHFLRPQNPWEPWPPPEMHAESSIHKHAQMDGQVKNIMLLAAHRTGDKDIKTTSTISATDYPSHYYFLKKYPPTSTKGVQGLNRACTKSILDAKL